MDLSWLCYFIPPISFWDNSSIFSKPDFMWKSVCFTEIPVFYSKIYLSLPSPGPALDAESHLSHKYKVALGHLMFTSEPEKSRTLCKSLRPD